MLNRKMQQNENTFGAYRFYSRERYLTIPPRDMFFCGYYHIISCWHEIIWGKRQILTDITCCHHLFFVCGKNWLIFYIFYISIIWRFGDLLGSNEKMHVLTWLLLLWLCLPGNSLMVSFLGVKCGLDTGHLAKKCCACWSDGYLSAPEQVS